MKELLGYSTQSTRGASSHHSSMPAQAPAAQQLPLEAAGGIPTASLAEMPGEAFDDMPQGNFYDDPISVETVLQGGAAARC